MPGYYQCSRSRKEGTGMTAGKIAIVIVVIVVVVVATGIIAKKKRK